MSETIPTRVEPAVPPPGLLEIFIAFATISLSGFGGVLAWSYRMLVEDKKWMTPQEYNDAFALAAFLPGPNIINLSVVFGRRIAGTPGAALALVGLVGPGFVMVVFVGFLYSVFGDSGALQRMLGGAVAAAAGLTISTTIKMSRPLLRDGLLMQVLALGVLVAIGLMRWPIYWVVAVAVPLSIAIAWWRQR